MLTWGQFREVRPELAEAGRGLFNFLPEPLGLGVLATTRKDGGPRLHPCCPLILDDHLLAFVIPSPKRRDLHRDGRYAFHCYPPADNEDAFYMAGRTKLVADKAVIASARAQYFTERKWTRPPDGFGEQELFEFLIDRCLLTRTNGHGDTNPRHLVWRS